MFYSVWALQSFYPFLNYCVDMGGIPQKWLFACSDCGVYLQQRLKSKLVYVQYAKAVI